MIRVGLKGLGDELGRIFGDELGDLLGLGFLADEEVLGGQDLHGVQAERRVHRMRLLALEIDQETLGGVVVGLDLAKPPAPVNDVRTRFHELKFGFGRLEGGILGNECGEGF